MSTRVELNRAMQENVKNIIENIAEDIRKQWIVWVRDFWWNCKLPDDENKVVSALWLCTFWHEYILGYKESDDSFLAVSNVVDQCENSENICYILKKDSGGDYYPLSNSLISFQDIRFTITNTDIKKLTIQLRARPSYRKGLSTDIIKNNSIQIQTSLSERFIKTH